MTEGNGKTRVTIRLTEQNLARVEMIGMAYGASQNAVVNAAIWMLAIHAGLPENESDAAHVV